MKSLIPAFVLLTLAASAVGCGSPSRVAASPKPIVYCWFPDSRNWDTSSIDWTAITHISYRAVQVQADGALSKGPSAARVKQLVQTAHSHGAKVSVLVWGASSEVSSAYLANCPDKMAQSIVDYVKANDLDGVCIDDESYGPTNSVTGGPNRELVTNFFRVLRQKLKAARKDYELTFACVCTPLGAYAWYDWKAIAGQVDHLAIMSYCVTPYHVRKASPFQPIAGGVVHPEKPGEPAWTRDFTSSVRDFVDAVGPENRSKLLIGIDIRRVGVEWRCDSDKLHAPAVADGKKVKPDEIAAGVQKHGRRFDATQQSAWYCYRDGDKFVQVWYDDDETLAMKFKFAADSNIGGVCLWVLSSSEPPSTFEMIHRELLKTPATQPVGR